MGICFHSPVGKFGGGWTAPLTSILCWAWEWVELYLYSLYMPRLEFENTFRILEGIMTVRAGHNELFSKSFLASQMCSSGQQNKLPAVHMIRINVGNVTPNKSCLVNHWCHLYDTSCLLNVMLWHQVNRIWLPVVLEFHNPGINKLADLTNSKM